jgi:hypothetical protein
MVEHDAMIGQVLKKIDELGIADNTIVIYSTDSDSLGPMAERHLSSVSRGPPGKADSVSPCSCTGLV